MKVVMDCTETTELRRFDELQGLTMSFGVICYQDGVLTLAQVLGVKADVARLSLTSPACTAIGEKIALSRRIEKHWRLIGWANITT